MWKKPNPVKDKIFAMADSLRKQGVSPTTLNIRAKIGGSQTTVSKYLRQWRELYECEEDLSPKKMQKQLLEQAKINETLSAELLNASQQATSSLVEISNLKAQVLVLETRLEEQNLAASQQINNLQQLNQSTADAFANATEAMAMQLTAINEQAIQKVQEAGFFFDEKVLELKLEVRELKSQLALKDKEIKRLKLAENADRGVNDYSN
jgi:hypothetical protein